MIENPTTKKKSKFKIHYEKYRIETIKMANYEHFSSTFRRFSIYASRHYPTNNWDLLGSFVGSNIRKLQEFKLNFSAEEIVEGDAPYYGYMKLVIHDYHGLEYYCPISTL